MINKKLYFELGIKRIFILFFLFIFNVSLGQDERGSSLLNSNRSSGMGKIHAVIVGVSAYSNLPEGKQLNFADDDAKEFYEFLIQQPNVIKDNIVLLMDEEAVLPKVDNAIRHQMRNAEEGDTFIFFFAGHGDVQKSINTGFLLLHDVNLGNEYSWDDAYALNDLEKNAKAFTNRKKGNVILITDACHSGKLITDNEYSKAFTTGLVAEWENTIKMVSCDARQVSFEDTYWGGGNGVFTYYLLEALSGKADTEEIDKKISIRELEDYVGDKVSKDVKERKGVYQEPEFEGNKELVPFTVINLENQSPSSDIVASNVNTLGGRGLNDVAYDLSEYTESLLKDFNDALDQKLLLNPQNAINNDKLEIIKNEMLVSNLAPIVNFQVNSDNNTMYAIENNRVLTKWNTKNGLQEEVKSRLPILASSYEIDEANGVLIASTNEKISVISTKNWVDVLSVLPITNTSQKFAGLKRAGSKLIYNPKKNFIEIWDTNSWKKSSAFKAGKKVITSIEVAEKQNKLFVASNNLIYAYSINGTQIGKLSGHSSNITNVFISPDETKLVSIASNSEIIIWDAKTLKQIQKLNTASINAELISFSPQSKWFAIAGNKQLVIIDLITENTPNFVDFNTKELSGLQFTSSSTIHYSLKNSIGKFQFKQPSRYASDIYELLLKQKDIEPIKEEITGQLVAALQWEAQQIIKPFALGEEIVPSIAETEHAILQLDYALNIMDDEFANKTGTESKKLFLQGFEILLKHAVNRYDEAIGYFEKVTILEPDAAYPHNAISLVLNKQNKLKEAKDKLAIAIETTPRWYEPKSNLGKTLLKEGKFEEALEEFQKIITLYPQLSKGYYNMSLWHLAKGDLLASEHSIEKALEVDAENPALMTQAAIIAKKRGQFKKASSLLELSIEKAGTYYKPYLELAEIKTEEYLYYAGDEKLLLDALKLLEQANELSDYLPEVNQSLGDFYLTLFESYPLESIEGLPDKDSCLSKAKTFISNAALLAPFDTKTFDSEAKYHLLKNNTTSGKNTLDNHLSETPEYPQAYISLGNYVFDVLEDAVSAEKEFALALEINPNYMQSYLSLASYYDRVNNELKRDSVLQLGIETFPNSPLLRFEQGKYWLNNIEKKKEGILSLRKAIELDPEYKLASTSLFAVNASEKKEFIEAGYESVQSLNENSLLVKKDDKYFFADITGMVVSDIYYDKVILSGNGKMTLERDGLKGYKDLKNNVIVPIEYEDIRFQKDGSLIVKSAQKEGWINAVGEMIIPLEYESLTLMKSGLIRAKKDEVYGALSKEDGSEKIPFKYKKITDGIWSTGNIKMLCCYFGENDSDAIDGNGKVLGKCNRR